MGQKSLSLVSLMVLCLWGAAQVGFAETPGPESKQGYTGPDFVVIRSTVDVESVAKPAYLPHRAHQWLECEGCHHGKGPDGKKLESIAGQKIEPCETCHSSKNTMPVKVATLKRASHRLCMECHLKQSKELARCEVCHTKK